MASNALPPNVLTHLLSKSSHVHSQLMKEGLINFQHAGNLVRLMTAKKLDEIGPAEARSVDKVLQLPVTQQ